ncbi:hypothetical protein K8O68_14195 [Salipaludibacillus sp. CUR1]|uniref:hypothetical protein n=1 Tax=Salipaludibacillus sp. CUR1 TaxID=2820003 RepID=UPI001E46DA04|nr:hypothetical protein [Salipaludibacillus sp. CUR1]MCE7793572.1 hypothetical protein [Salipaludibacillus sp. CUR1]
MDKEKRVPCNSENNDSEKESRLVRGLRERGVEVRKARTVQEKYKGPIFGKIK